MTEDNLNKPMLKIVKEVEPVSNVTDITTANARKYIRLMSELRNAIKTLSHNELSRQYVALYAQHVLLTKLHDDLKASVAADLNNQVSNLQQPANINPEPDHA